MNTRANNIKVWPHLGILFIVFALLGGLVAALWMRHEPKAEALALPHAARVERVDGEVGLSRSLAANRSEPQWIELAPNTPVTVGDRLYAREDSRASLAFTGRNFARLEPSSSLDVLTLSDRRTQLALRQGSAIFNIGALAPGEMFEVATPYGAVDFREPGLYQMGYNDDGSAFISVLSGLAQVVGLAGSGEISKGEMLTLLGQTAAQVALSRLSPDYAGGVLDDYYAYQYPDIYDGRYRDYDAYLRDPDYYDPYNRYTSYRYVPDTIPGVYDLDLYGEWQNLNGYGYAWNPRVDAGWAPYQQGSWMLDDPYGLTWVSNEPWGYAPYHYGRWVNVEGRWYWVPESGNTQPAYAPALVAFVPLAETNQVGWLPLAPGDPYAPAYYDANWQPHYPSGSPALAERIMSMGVPGALTVVSVDDFNRLIERSALARVRPEDLERTRPVLDPLSHALLRQASLRNATAHRGFVLPPGLAKRLDDTQVYASARPAAPPFRDEMARAFRVEAVPEQGKREKLKFKDERQAGFVEGPHGALPGRGDDKRSERQLRQLEKAQERAARREESGPQRGPAPVPLEAGRPAGRFEQHAQGERVGSGRHARKDEERQRADAAQQQQRAAALQQAETRRQQAAQQRAQQAPAQRAQQQERMRVKPSHPRPAAQAPQKHVQQQQGHAPKGHNRPQGPPAQAAKPHGQGNGGGKGRGKP